MICIEPHKSKYYHLGFGKGTITTNFANDNEKCYWRIFEKDAFHLIDVARKSSASDHDFLLDIDGIWYMPYDATIVDLCLNVFLWTVFCKTKEGIKLHTLYEIKLPYSVVSKYLPHMNKMNYSFCIASSCLLILTGTSHKDTKYSKNLVALVNPFIDTHNSRWIYFNSASRPFGMVSLSPDTDTDGTWSSGYLYESEKVRCISHIHAWQLSGVAVMPTTGTIKGHLGMDIYQSAFSHESEIAKPGYHRLVLEDYGIQVELTSTSRVGFHRYIYPRSEESRILFDATAHLGPCSFPYAKVWIVNEKEIAGYQIMGKTMRRPKDTPVYFVARLNKSIEKFIGWKEMKLIENIQDTIEGSGVGAAVQFSTKANEEVLLKVALSYVSVEQARLNLETELNHWDFDRVKQNSYAEWNEWLGKIEIDGGSHEQQVKFYTDLWHSLLGRRILSDIDGKYMDMTGDIPEVKQKRLGADGKPLFPHYNFDAWWGCHWSLSILWPLAYPEVMDGFCNTMVDMYHDGRLLPRGPSGGNYTYVMIGDPSACVLASAYNKGIRNYDIELAYEGVRKNAFPGGIRDHAGYEHDIPASGGGMEYYMEIGYVPEDVGEKGLHRDGASMTLEYAYEDWCIAQLAKNLGKKDDYDYFMHRSLNYKNIWNPETGYMHPREKDGSWMKDLTPNTRRGFCESIAAIYTQFVPHDIDGLIGLFPSRQAYIDRLNSQFESAAKYNFNPDSDIPESELVDYTNQPGTGLAHIFNLAGAPWLSQKWVRRIKEKNTDITPYGGYIGDEDQGQMGALGVLMAIGLFQVDGGASAEPKYEITSPIFNRITIHLNGDYYTGESFVIETIDNSKENMYIQKAVLNGEPWNHYSFPHDMLQNGGKLELYMGPEPNTSWGTGQ